MIARKYVEYIQSLMPQTTPFVAAFGSYDEMNFTADHTRPGETFIFMDMLSVTTNVSWSGNQGSIRENISFDLLFLTQHSPELTMSQISDNGSIMDTTENLARSFLALVASEEQFNATTNNENPMPFGTLRPIFKAMDSNLSGWVLSFTLALDIPKKYCLCCDTKNINFPFDCLTPCNS